MSDELGTTIQSDRGRRDLVTNDRARPDEARWARVEVFEHREARIVIEGTVDALHAALLADGWAPASEELLLVGKSLSVRPYVRTQSSVQTRSEPHGSEPPLRPAGGIGKSVLFFPCVSLRSARYGQP